MPMASCKNCCHLVGATGCELGLAPDAGELLCRKYSMTIGFREELLRVLREDINREINQAVARVRIQQAEATQAFAG